MSWHEKYLSTNQNKKSISSQTDLFALFEEVWKEQENNLTEKQRSMLSDDFYQNSLFEIFSGIDYSKLTRRPLTENKDYKTLLREWSLKRAKKVAKAKKIQPKKSVQ